jgi:hypothetical protein
LAPNTRRTLGEKDAPWSADVQYPADPAISRPSWLPQDLWQLTYPDETALTQAGLPAVRWPGKEQSASGAWGRSDVQTHQIDAAVPSEMHIGLIVPRLTLLPTTIKWSDRYIVRPGIDIARPSGQQRVSSGDSRSCMNGTDLLDALEAGFANGGTISCLERWVSHRDRTEKRIMMTMFVLGLLSSAFLVCCSLAMTAGILAGPLTNRFW